MLSKISKCKELIFIAHRGASGYEPENTILAIQKAMALGANWIEIDVHYVDGNLLVIHDETVTHPNDGIVNIYDHKFEYLRKIDIGKNQMIPTLEEVLLLTNNKVCLNVELKGKATAKPVCELITQKINDRSWERKNFLLSSFIHEELSIARKLAPNIKLGLLIEDITFDFINVARDLHVNFINISFDIVTRDIVHDIHKHGMKVLVYTVDDEESLRLLVDIGVDGIFTNYIDRCNKIIN